MNKEELILKILAIINKKPRKETERLISEFAQKNDLGVILFIVPDSQQNETWAHKYIGCDYILNLQLNAYNGTDPVHIMMKYSGWPLRQWREIAIPCQHETT